MSAKRRILRRVRRFVFLDALSRETAVSTRTSDTYLNCANWFKNRTLPRLTRPSATRYLAETTWVLGPIRGVQNSFEALDRQLTSVPGSHTMHVSARSVVMTINFLI